MGGHTASILLPRLLTEAQSEELDRFLTTVSSRRDADGSFWVPSTWLPEPGSAVTYRPFALSIVPAVLEPDESSLDRVVAVYGFRPVLAIQLDAFCNQDEDHQILGHLTLEVVETFGGVVDFGGALLPPLPNEMTRHRGMWLEELAQWPDIAPYFDAMVKELPGTIIAIPYPCGGGRTWITHVADALFLRGWLAHPAFRMIK